MSGGSQDIYVQDVWYVEIVIAEVQVFGDKGGYDETEENYDSRVREFDHVSTLR